MNDEVSAMPLRVVVLAHHSLFASGIASRFSERPDLFEIQSIDTGSSDALAQLRVANPAIVVVDAIDAGVAEKMPIGKLLEVLPEAKVVQLLCNSDEIRIFSSEQRQAHEIDELIAVMQSLGAT